MYCSKKANVCAHGRDSKITCYNKMELLLIAEQIEYIEGKVLQFKRSDDKIELWKDIAAYMKSKYQCTDEICWVETLNLKEIEKTAFKPIMPNDWLKCNASFAPNQNCMNTWLSNLEIDEVMTQFQTNIPNFEYLGAVPIDFANLQGKKVNSFSIEQAISDKKNKIGVIFNTDPSYKGGQHWICAFIDLEKKEIDYFDSYGSDGTYPNEVNSFFRKLTEEGKKIGYEFTVKKNLVRHQYKNSECGVYCLKFIADRLNHSFEEIIEGNMPDDTVTEERWKRFFRTETCRPHII